MLPLSFFIWKRRGWVIAVKGTGVEGVGGKPGVPAARGGGMELLADLEKQR